MSQRTPAASAVALCLMLVLPACSRFASDPESSDTPAAAARMLGSAPADGMWPDGRRLGAGRGFYPLAVGNRWVYDIRFRTTLITPGGPQPTVETTTPWTVEIIGERVENEHRYFMLAEYDPRIVGPQVPFRVRQDRSGYYSSDAITTASPAARSAPAMPSALQANVEQALAGAPHAAAFRRATETLAIRLATLTNAGAAAMRPVPGGPEPGETAQLRYPLRIGARWVVRESPLFERVVVGLQPLRLPAGMFPAWRLRQTSELFGPDDSAQLWYSRSGLLRIAFRGKADATDEAGNIVGQVIIEQDQVLSTLRLVDPDDPRPAKH